MRPLRFVEALALGAACAAAFAGPVAAEEPQAPAQAETKAGFFRVANVDGVWWWIAPDGSRFFSRGVNHVSFDGDFAPTRGHSPYKRVVEKKYGTRDAWAREAAKRLRAWGFNTVASWSSDEMQTQKLAYTVVADLAKAGGFDFSSGSMPDMFAPAFERAVGEQARRVCEPRKNDPWLLGYFTDNELRWTPDQRSPRSLFDIYLELPPDAPGKQALVRMLRERFATVEAFNQAWGTTLGSLDELAALEQLPAGRKIAADVHRAFMREVARRYFKVAHDAVRAVDPNHLILGSRFAGHAPDGVIAMMKPYVDVVSFNDYGGHAPGNKLQRIHTATGLPVLLGEFSFRAKFSGLPNTIGPGPIVKSQQERAQGYERYVTALARMPFVVGFHWFKYADEPPDGRFDGENGNYGVVRNDDEVWTALADGMKRVNSRIDTLHASSARSDR
jgi:hypothetical protein